MTVIKHIMNNFDHSLSGVLKQILDDFQILTNLQDGPNDLGIIKIELTKINRLLHITIYKLESTDNKSNDFVELLSIIKSYLKNYDFFREIEAIALLYSKDSQRVKNLRHIVLEALQEKKLMEKIKSLIAKLE